MPRRALQVSVPVILLSISVLLQLSFHPSANAFAAVDTTPPSIELWYGSRQEFGRLGQPIRWVNILGRSVDDESGVSSMTYRLNGGSPVSLRIGPDLRRLAKLGDFNIELDAKDLREGTNTIELEARNGLGMKTVTQMQVIFTRDAVWPLPYTIDWSKVNRIEDVVQVVDGKWKLEAGGVRPAEVAYDRFLALGDMTWTDYEVTVQVIPHGINTNAYNVPQSGGAGFGLVFRWLGHTDNPVVCSWPAQPHCGWNPLGASNWYSFKKTGIDTLAIEAEPPKGSAMITSRKLAFGHTYIFKAQVETTPEGNHYRFKVWEPAVEHEPAGWTLERVAQPGDDAAGNLRHGSVLLAAHEVDVTFGNVTITPLQSAVQKSSRSSLPVAQR